MANADTMPVTGTLNMVVRRYTLTVFFSLLTFYAFCSTEQEDSISLKFNDILLNLERKITTTKPGNDYVVRSFNFTLEKIRQGKISIVFDDELNFGITGCASANISESGAIGFSFGRFVLDAYDTFPTLIEGIIVHEFQHIYDFLTKPKLVEISRNNPIENSYFEVDATTLEGLYFDSYRTESDKMSRLENFFLADINSGFWSVIAIFDGIDLQLLHQIDEVEMNAKASDEAIQSFVNIGAELLKRVEFGENRWNNYCNLVSLRTFSFYSRQVVHDILFALDEKDLSDDELRLSDFPTVDATVSQVLEIQDQYQDFFDDFRSEVVKSYNDDVLSTIK